MLLKGNRGIACDLCLNKQLNDFDYFSYDVYAVDRPTAEPDYGSLTRRPPIFSFDICAKCHTEWSAVVVSHYAAMQPRCELTGLPLEQQHYFVDVTGVAVRFSGQPQYCKKCHKPITQLPCACGSSESSCTAAIEERKRQLEFRCNESIYRTLVNTTVNNRTTAGQWATT